MKVCFPVQRNEGVESRVYNHFGSAPMFVVVDTEINDVSVVTNSDRNHSHGACNPIRALGDQEVDAVVLYLLDQVAFHDEGQNDHPRRQGP